MPVERNNNNPKWHKIPLCYPAICKTEGQEPKIILEIGPGRGDFLFRLAKINTSAVVIGIELKSRRYFKLIECIKNLGLTNVQVIQTDARYAVASLFQPKSVNEIHINFPDPWPKRKHTKNRLINEEFLKACSRILKAGGFISFITDAKDYAEDAKKISGKIKGLKSLPGETESIYPTFYANKWKKEGRSFYHQKWTT